MKILYSILFILCLVSCQNLSRIKERKIDVAKVVSDFPVDFSLLTYNEMQFVAYYDTAHRMTVASRHLGEDKWVYKVLDSSIGWDSHNNITMKVDKEGYLHLSGNMHVSPLVYYRTESPLDITTLKRIDYMTGENERYTTYPQFMDGPEGKLIFHYRDGGSGNGNEIYNVYDYNTQTWSKLLDCPLTDGEGLMNAYMDGPTLGPDEYYHLLWVWRDTYDCSTNHHLSYAKSKDLVHWVNIADKSVELPITISDTCTWVDPIPVKGGIINGAAKMGFDSNNNLLITYHKYDEAGNTQGYITRYENNGWKIVPLSKWNYRWNFQGGGSIGKGYVVIGAPFCQGLGVLKINFEHIKEGKGYWLVDEKTLSPMQEYVTGKSEGYGPTTETEVPLVMNKCIVPDAGNRKTADCQYFLEWYSFPANRDTIRTTVKAVPSMLQVVERKLKW